MSEFLTEDNQSSQNPLPNGHPVKVYLDENQLIRDTIENINNTNIKDDFEHFTIFFDKLCLIEKHYARKENQLFPYLETYGWTSPSQNMWAFHDQIRDEIKIVRKNISDDDIVAISQNLQTLFQSIYHLMQVEEQRLLPNALNMLSADDWEEIKAGDEEIGWMFDKSHPNYPNIDKENQEDKNYIHPSQDTKKRKLPFSLDGRIRLNEGYMLEDQLNLMLQFMPVDLTYVDENDIVIFYNRGENRVFPRSAGIIGREVKFCHPPKSVDQVLMILREFKAGRRDEAEFWIEFKGKFIHIQYFAIRDENGTYKGVIEMSQDVTHIRNLKGQQRLLDWE
jgi:DUF438 domain-containing protein